MKLFKISLVACAVATSQLSVSAKPYTGEDKDHPKDGFESLNELREFAGASSFGAGFVTTHQLGGREVHVVNRCFTSGAPTAELSIYLPRATGKGFYCALFQPMRPVEIRTAVEKDTIVFTQYDNTKRA